MAFFSFTNISTGDNRPPMEKQDEQRLLYLSFFMPMVFIAMMWIVHIFQIVTQTDLGKYGILPKHVEGLPGILFSPFIHGDFQHLISNTVPFLILSFLMIFNYRKVAFKAFVFIYLVGGFLLWLTGRENYHIGASGLIYGMAFFIFFSGVFRKNLQAIALSLFVVFLYGSIVWGMFPLDMKISWEGHAMGAVCGFVSAFYFRNVDRPAPIVLEDDPDDEEMIDDDQTIEVHYEIIEDKPKP